MLTSSGAAGLAVGYWPFLQEGVGGGSIFLAFVCMCAKMFVTLHVLIS